MDLYGHEDPVCPECRKSYRSQGDIVFFVDGEWLCRSCFVLWAKEEVTDLELAEALGVMTMQERSLV